MCGGEAADGVRQAEVRSRRTLDPWVKKVNFTTKGMGSGGVGQTVNVYAEKEYPECNVGNRL